MNLVKCEDVSNYVIGLFLVEQISPEEVMYGFTEHPMRHHEGL
jgi:hypothetical protein